VTILRTTKAEHDLTSIAEYLSQRNPAASRYYENKFLNAFDLLIEQPRMGRNRLDLHANLRSWPVPPYILFYTVSCDELAVVRVLHMAQSVESDLFD